MEALNFGFGFWLGFCAGAFVMFAIWVWSVLSNL